MNSVTIAFGKDKTAIIKGIAITMMIILHCSSPSWFDIPIPALEIHPWLSGWLSMGKLCVGIFAFMVGYGYSFAKKKDWHYSWQHIKRLLIPFWTIMFIFIFPIAWYYEQLGGTERVILNLFGINSELNWVSWFVAFFIYAMLVLPFMSRVIDRWPLMGALFLVLFTWCVEVAIHSIPGWSENNWTQRLFDCMLQSPKMIVGYLFAHQQWYTSIKISRHWYVIPTALFAAVLVFIMRYNIGTVAGFNFDAFYAPMFILLILIVFNLYNLPLLRKVLVELGDTSVYMWFFHAVFFTKAVRSFYQPLITWSDNLWIIIIWTILLTYVCSWILKKMVDCVEDSISKL